MMPIGIFDSGLGGLTALKEAKKLAAKSDFVNKVFSKELIEAYCG